MTKTLRSLGPALALSLMAASAAFGAPAAEIAKPTAKDWADLAKLPDFSGIWLPQGSPAPAVQPEWLPAAAAQIAAQRAAEEAGKPQNFYVNCLPEGMPSFIIMTLNAVEILPTPGRLTILGEFDGNRLRRIYTDGRGHPADPDPTFNGHSVGRWEGSTLVVDTVGLLPQVYLPLGQAVGLPNNGDMHIVERIHFTDADTLQDDLEITAPKVLAKTWKTSRTFKRTRDRANEIVEASCRQGDFIEDADAQGNAVYTAIPHEEGGAPLPPPAR